MSKIPTHAKTIELEDKERKRKLSKLLYHTDDMMEILGDIVTDYIKQVSLMKRKNQKGHSNVLIS